MIITSRDTIGGYRIEICSENEQELKLLKEIENNYADVNKEILESINKSLIKIRNKEKIKEKKT